MEMRLQVFMAHAGFASRRKSEAAIEAGQVRVNGQVVTELGTKIDPAKDRITIQGRRFYLEAPVYVLLHKPKGYVSSTNDPEGRPTVVSLVRTGARLYSVGRLDYNTEGLLILTNDGDLANALMHPRKEIEKTYEVKVRGHLQDQQLAAMAEGMELDDDNSLCAPAKVRRLGATDKNDWIEVTIHEGKNRQIHRMIESLGTHVLKLKRTRYAGLELGDLHAGRWRYLMGREVQMLFRKTGVKPKLAAGRSSP